ncbi:hypothetical protein BU23DRAFT_531126 [Bimuria novae-zelandiae CBS 107.79]|uniref:Protein HRI1 n=1 Tax=Bimuria novae-zelandiae CBS 107.79 TaxID=1447943 RepID=A0A6A5VN12_9PLEO|nr:hypothetical protein BU23DRAFT_531126 [Bimuria novae-zelandiae CBS 107.79]
MTTTDPANTSISRRDYFYPLPHPLVPGTPVPYSLGLPTTNPLNLPEKPVEPTHTLVLTSSRKQFVDVRVFRPILPLDPELPNEGGPRARLDWAFAGSSTSTPIPDPHPHGVIEKPSTAHRHPEHHRTWPAPITRASWTHWLDSRHPLPAHLSPSHDASTIPKDEGTMYPLNATQTLECGEGINPSTGNMWSYEEFWTDLPVEVTPSLDDPDPPKFSIVLRLDTPEHAVRGVVIRLGAFCQGVVVKGDYVSVERWEWRQREGKGEVGEQGEWKRTVRIGDQFLPCTMTFKPELLAEGGTVKYWDYVWQCEERVAWRETVEVAEGVDSLDD